MNSRDIIRALERDGWRRMPVSGGHHVFGHPTKPGRVIVPHPRHDVPLGTLRSIERQSGLRLRPGP
jgi:predicted RNA binding protein YcfA (HicA-like mRNA interferase family)